MSGTVLASSSNLLATGPSVLQALSILALLAVLIAREAVRLRSPTPPVMRQLDVGVRVLAPVVICLLALRLLVILQ